ncbi:dienelactone hydrolase [Scytonema sp. HK-05]|nr:dienelactone hydrolase [Scytonema sp. HK-05]
MLQLSRTGSERVGDKKMQITNRNVELRVDDSLMRVYVAAPKAAGLYPGIVFYSDIYQLGGSIIRLANYLAGYGYVVAAPEIFHRIEPIGLAIEPDDLGRMRVDTPRHKCTGILVVAIARDKSTR